MIGALKPWEPTLIFAALAKGHQPPVNARDIRLGSYRHVRVDPRGEFGSQMRE
jgi:hypothetical protein